MSLSSYTVRLKAEFRDFDGVLTSPTGVVLKVYDKQKVQIGTDISVTATSTGLFQYDYTLPSDANPVYYEFKGTLNTKPILGRAQLPVTWI